MIPQEKVDDALDTVLRASGSALKYYTMPSTLEGMREAMNKIMTTSYTEGSGDNSQALKLAHEVERCYLMLLSESDTKAALFKAENILREAVADQAKENKMESENKAAKPSELSAGLGVKIVAWRRTDTARSVMTEDDRIARGWEVDGLFFQALVPKFIADAEIERLRRALMDCDHQADSMRVWGGMGWRYHPPQAGIIHNIVRAALDAVPNTRVNPAGVASPP